MVHRTALATTDQLGNTLWQQEYSQFGYHERNTGQLDQLNQTSFGLTGHVEDQHEDLLLVYMQARYYDPLMGRFLSIDPVGFSESNPQSFNRYAYANNNPHRYVDPDGNVIFLVPFIYSAATFVVKEVAVGVISNYVPAVQYVGTRKLLTHGVKSAGKLFGRKGGGDVANSGGAGTLDK